MSRAVFIGALCALALVPPSSALAQVPAAECSPTLSSIACEASGEVAGQAVSADCEARSGASSRGAACEVWAGSAGVTAGCGGEAVQVEGESSRDERCGGIFHVGVVQLDGGCAQTHERTSGPEGEHETSDRGCDGSMSFDGIPAGHMSGHCTAERTSGESSCAMSGSPPDGSCTTPGRAHWVDAPGRTEAVVVPAGPPCSG